MNNDTTDGKRPRFTLSMILCGIAAAASVGAMNAAMADEVPRLAFKFDPHSLDTESGTRDLYDRLRRAAEEACPAPVMTGTRLVSGAIRHCREELVSRVVYQIANPRLVALYNDHAKSG